MSDHERPDQPLPGAAAMVGIGFVCAVLGLFSWVFGLAGMILGALGHARGGPGGLRVAVMSGITMIIGMIILQLAVT